MLSVMLLTSIMLLYWAFWPFQPLVLRQPIEVTAVREMAPGTAITYKLDYCKYSSASAEVHYVVRGLDNSIIEIPGMTLASIDIGCHVVKVSITILMDLEPGKYQLEMTRIYTLTPLSRRVSVVSLSQVFEIGKHI